ncbi:MAG: hypothetical protein IJT06_02235 [Selenomonadaceae bacterium]|nr:hypothetical protein [Selenomonadaceae bacterium]
MKKRKRKKLRDKFTDALGEEISSRENLNIEKKEQERLKKNTVPKVNLAKATAEKNFELPEQKLETSEQKLETAEKKIQPPELPQSESQIEIVQVEVDPKLEQKIFEEADNKFLENKIRRPRRKLTAEGDPAPPRPTFRVKAMQERLAEKSVDDKKSTSKDSDLRRNLTRAEITGAVISAVMLVYSATTLDKPLFFLAMSLLTHTVRPLIGSFFGKYNRPVQNALRGFSITIFFGALLLLVI